MFFAIILRYPDIVHYGRVFQNERQIVLVVVNGFLNEPLPVEYFSLTSKTFVASLFVLTPFCEPV